MKKTISVILVFCMLLSCIAASGFTVFAEEDQPQVVYLACPKDNLNQTFPLVQKNKSGGYILYAGCWPGYGATAEFKDNDPWKMPAFKCQFEGEQGDYLMFSADISKVGTIEENADYVLQFFTNAMTWTLTMTSDCLGDTVVVADESVMNADGDTVYFADWKNNPQCGMRAQLLADNTLWCEDKGCDKLPVYAPKATFISDALNKYLLINGSKEPGLNSNYADAEKNLANCQKLGIVPADVLAQYTKDNAKALAEGEKQQLTLNGQEVSAVLYNGKYIADSSYIAKILGLSDEPGEFLFKDKFYDFASWEGAERNYEDVLSYDELFYHHDEQNKVDWALVYGTTWYVTPMEIYAVLGDRVITQNSGYVPFILGYGVYDVKADTFTDLGKAYGDNRYEGLQEAFEALNVGMKIGDMNNDNEVNIKDATMIQKSLACLTDFPEFDNIAEGRGNAFLGDTPQLSYLSDVNRNGRRDIGDATAVQRIAAKMQ